MKLERKVYEDDGQKKKDFFIGGRVLIGINVVLWVILLLLNSMEAELHVFGFSGIMRVFFLLLFVVNLGVFIYFCRTRYWIAFGMLGSIALGLLIVVLFSAVCYGGRII